MFQGGLFVTIVGLQEGKAKGYVVLDWKIEPLFFCSNDSTKVFFIVVRREEGIRKAGLLL